MKPILSSLLLLMSLSLFGQEETPFGEHVFQKMNIGYNQETKELIVPDKSGRARKECRAEVKPDRYTCSLGSGLAHVYIDESSPSNFETTVFHPDQRTVGHHVAISSKVRDGKVVRQSRTVYDSQWVSKKKESHIHNIVARLESHVITANLCSAINQVQDEKSFRDEEIFKGILKVLNSSEYKHEVLEAHKLNYRNTFLYINSERDNYEYYSKLPKREYRDKVEGKNDELKVVDFSQTSIIKGDPLIGLAPAKSLYDVYKRNKTLFNYYYYEPCKLLAYDNILANPSADSVTKKGKE